MNELQIFNNNDFGEVRTVLVDGEPYLVGKDVANILGYQNGSRDINRHVDDEDRTKIMVFDGNQVKETIVINESGLYSLILSSKMPNAKKFKRWVTSEVLPAIRKHGSYMTPEILEAAILNPDTIIKIATALKNEQDKNKALQEANSFLTVENAIMAPKAQYFDDLVDRNLLTNFRETAKQLQVKERNFVNFLLERKYLYRDKRGKLMPYAQHVDNGLFEMKECFNEKTSWSGTQTMITPKGRETFRLLYMKSA